MYVKDYMSEDIINITPSASIIDAADLMKKNDINRLPVIEAGKLVGLITREIVTKNSPSNATSLSKHEINYLLDKTKIQDVMTKKYLTVSPEDQIERAATLMRSNNNGVVLVLDNDKLVGILTDKDIFKAFADISGYNEAGSNLVIELAEDRPGVIEEVGDALVETEKNLTHMLVYHLEAGIRIVLHIDGHETDSLCKALENRGYSVGAVYEKEI